MSTMLEELTDKAMQLPVEERELLIERLILASGDLPAMDPKILAECDRRARELEEGTVKGLTVEESRQRVREKLPWLT